jgi:phenylpropionate dioxygenase-like ring-hydroxylating dioxygenase large terminal subunit
MNEIPDRDPPRSGDGVGSGTLPAQWYTDPGHFQVELDQIISRGWHCVGRESSVARAGEFLTATAGRIPILVARGRDEVLRAFVNVCRHRGHEVMSGSGACRVFQCPYHGWTYELAGALRSAPRGDRELEALGNIALEQVVVETWNSFVFVNPDHGCTPLTDVLGHLPETMLKYGFDFESLEHRKRITYDLQANWKVYVENSLECYHCPVAHPELSKLVDMKPDAYRLFSAGQLLWQESQLRNPVNAEDAPGPVLTQEEGIPDFQFYYVWPTFMIAPSHGRLWSAQIQPLDERTTRVVTDFYFESGLADHDVEESAAFSDRVLEEDRSLIESVQRGLESGRIERGILLSESEALIASFQRLVADTLASSCT